MLCRELLNDDQPPRKSILKRDAHSFDDPRQGFLCPERMMLDRKAKSFEEREEEYEKARTRIFRNRESDESYWSWHHEKGDQISRLRQNKMLKVKSMVSIVCYVSLRIFLVCVKSFLVRNILHSPNNFE